jgi:hypothetical protein
MKEGDVKKLIVLATILMVTGCASTGVQNMTAEQLKAFAADKNFSAVCSNVTSRWWGMAHFLYANVDKGMVPNGTITVDANCLVTMSNNAVIGPPTKMQAVNIPLPVTVTPQLVQ